MGTEQFEAARNQARALPHNSGCYLMHDAGGTVIYVGKAKDLHRRVNQYFLPDRDAKTRALVAHIHTIEHIITGNDYEAFVLENNLIKKYNPHYNILLKDGKSYPLIRITNEEFPKVFSTRRVIKDGSRYFGPFPDGGRLQLFLELADSLFKFRKCSVPLKKRATPCLYYHIGRCSAPCCGLADKAEYAKGIAEVTDLLEGRSESLKRELTAQMYALSKAMDFEEAAKKRDLIRAIDTVTTAQNVEGFDPESRDYAAIEMRSPLCSISIMQFREGKLLGKAIYRAETFSDEGETLVNFLTQYYQSAEELPKQLFVSSVSDCDLIKRFFKEQLSSDVEISVPEDGKDYRILRMSKENAKRDVEILLRSRDNTEGLLELRNVLNLPDLPALIEGFDIAQLSGKYTVASLISFKDGNPDPKNYRRFNMRTLNGAIDDFASIAEAVRRRYTRVVKENLPRPDLILIDGGKGQVNAARDVLDEVGLAETPVVGLAKQYETIVFDDEREEIRLPHDNAGLRILIAVRDECHRFATGANQAMRSRDVSFKVLESVQGIGPKTSARLIDIYGSVDAILEDTPEEIAKKAGISEVVAQRIINRLGV